MADTAAPLATITKHDALAALRTVVAGHEYHVYVPPGPEDRCRYEINGAASCVIGRALLVLGFSLDDLRVLDDQQLDAQGFLWGSVAASHIPQWAIAGRLPDQFTRISQEAAGVFGVMQRHQDIRETWGRALTMAQHYAEVAAQRADLVQLG